MFWETTKACSLACVHCRASAQTSPLEGELGTEEGFQVIDHVVSFHKPYPTLVFTGGDPLERNDIFDLLSYAKDCGVNFAVSPAVTPRLADRVLERFADLKAASISISLDGASAATHDSIRKVQGTFDLTIDRIKSAVKSGLNAQINTAVMRLNLMELPQIFHLIKNLGVKTWEIFFLVQVGRGATVEDLSPMQCESLCHFLYDASRSGMTIRCVEAPFIRRVLSERSRQQDGWRDQTYLELRTELVRLNGPPRDSSTIRPKGTLDGDGVVFVGHDGSIYPGGLLPVRIGNTKQDSLSRVYKQNELLRNVRARRLNGSCGVCEFKEVCGGSRARAYSYQNDPLASDPACLLVAGTAR